MDLQHWESDRVYLQIEEETLPVEPNKGYSITLSDYDKVETTEAGTSVREVTRVDIPQISVGFECNLDMLKSMRAYKKRPSLSVKYFNPENEDGLSSDIMYVTNYKEQMLADTKDGGIWKVSFDLEDLGDV